MDAIGVAWKLPIADYLFSCPGETCRTALLILLRYSTLHGPCARIFRQSPHLHLSDLHTAHQAIRRFMVMQNLETRILPMLLFCCLGSNQAKWWPLLFLYSHLLQLHRDSGGVPVEGSYISGP